MPTRTEVINTERENIKKIIQATGAQNISIELYRVEESEEHITNRSERLLRTLPNGCKEFELSYTRDYKMKPFYKVIWTLNGIVMTQIMEGNKNLVQNENVTEIYWNCGGLEDIPIPENYCMLQMNGKKIWEGSCSKIVFFNGGDTFPIISLSNYDKQNSVNQGIQNHFIIKEKNLQQANSFVSIKKNEFIRVNSIEDFEKIFNIKDKSIYKKINLTNIFGNPNCQTERYWSSPDDTVRIRCKNVNCQHSCALYRHHLDLNGEHHEEPKDDNSVVENIRPTEMVVFYACKCDQVF